MWTKRALFIGLISATLGLLALGHTVEVGSSVAASAPSETVSVSRAPASVVATGLEIEAVQESDLTHLRHPSSVPSSESSSEF